MTGLPCKNINFPFTKEASPLRWMYANSMSRAALMWHGMDSLVKGMYLVPLVVPDVLAKYRGLPGHKTSGSPATTRSTYPRIPS